MGFFKNVLSEENEFERIDYGFPTNKEALNEAMELWANDDDMERTITISGYDMAVPPLRDEDIEKLNELIDSCDKLYEFNGELYNIVTEEAFSYLEGDYSLETVCDNIQNRCNIYLMEKK